MPNDNQQPQLLDSESAYSVVHRNVYGPHFFQKLASDYGIQPANDQDAMQMMNMASQLRDAHESNEKQAADAGNPLLNSAQQHLNSSLGDAGYPVSGPQGNAIEKRAAEIASNPEIAHAVLSLQAEAAKVQQQQEAVV